MKESWYRKLFSSSALNESADVQGYARDQELEAHNNRGVLHCAQPGGEQGFPRALEAAEQGHALAQNNLGLMYSLGLGIPKDSAEASKWFHRSADQGDPGAQYHLGVLCQRASMDPISDAAHEGQIEAFKWFQLAADQGYWKADVSRERVNLKMTHADLAEARRRVAAFVRRKEIVRSE